MSRRIPPSEAPRPDLAYLNDDFLTSPPARMIRVQCELLEVEQRLRANNVRNTVVFFGSARIRPPEQSEGNPQLERMAKFYEGARHLAFLLSNYSVRLPEKKKFHLCSGGGPGIMEATNRGAFEAGHRSVAFGISLPFEQSINHYSSPELSFNFHYFFIRKFWFFYLTRALVVFPGGFGTMDEFFEMMTVIQTRKTTKHVPVILYGREFWNEVVNIPKLVEWGTISPEDLSLFHFADSPEEAFQIITKDFDANYLQAPAPYKPED
ncbi:MAG: LOG family protein [Opitutales bacterium]|nr:LOG family protein [Opitutales bacterium]